MEFCKMFEIVKNGNVTSAKGFVAGATYAGIKSFSEDALDIAILASEKPASVAGTFTSNKVVSPSVTLTKSRVESGVSMGVVANSGCANTCVGSQGFKDAEEMAALASKQINASEHQMLVCSTGLIGVELPMALVRQHMGNIHLDSDAGSSFAKAIMTTDTMSKEIAVSIKIGEKEVIIGGAAKGAGMIHPNMATMLAFISTDAQIEPATLKSFLKHSVKESFNMIDIDGDQSTNDTVLLFANGMSGVLFDEGDSDESRIFQEALTYVCIELAKAIVRDGEGSNRLIEVFVKGAKSEIDAKKAAREIVSSTLVKAMVHGLDPNWGRIMMALGKSEVDFQEDDVDVFISGIHVVHGGCSIPYLADAVVSSMNASEVKFEVGLNAGSFEARAWGCDLTEEYVTFNSAYST
tara:strand:+ start:904 stop:2127 length:1224 start_codon:yes stop_codon:yes gene_type:complete